LGKKYDDWVSKIADVLGLPRACEMPMDLSQPTKEKEDGRTKPGTGSGHDGTFTVLCQFGCPHRTYRIYETDIATGRILGTPESSADESV
jgi:hypothetical protein